jgi:hypothetical protein
MQVENLLVNAQLIKSALVIANRTNPLWPLLLKLQVGSDVKTLNMLAEVTTGRILESHVAERTLQ